MIHTQMHEKNSDNCKFECLSCGDILNSKSSYYRHITVCNEDDNVSKKSMEQLKKKLKKETENGKHKDKQIKELLEEIKLLKSIDKHNKKSNLTKFLSKTYPKAKPLKLSKNFSKSLLTFDEASKDHSFEYIIGYYSKTNSLYKFLGNFIISEFKSNDNNDRTMWCGDVSRKSFHIKGKNKWRYDSKGKDVTKIVILPIIAFIKQVTDDAITKEAANHVKNINNKHREDIHDYHKFMDRLGDISVICDDGTLCKQILDYIAPFFVYKEYDEVLDSCEKVD